jgi:hypothetical protein
MLSYQILNYDFILRIEIMNKTTKIKREEIPLSSSLNFIKLK